MDDSRYDGRLTPGMTIQVGVAGSYFEWRQKLITTRHDDGTDPWLLARMLECVTPDVPDMGPGGDLARANQVADEQAEYRLRKVAGTPEPVVRSSYQTLAVTGATLMLGSFMLMTLALIALFTRHYDLSFMLDGLFIAASQTGQRLIVKALKRKEQRQ